MKKTKQIISLLSAAAIVCGMTGCGNKLETVKTEDGRELKVVTFALDYTPNTNHTGIYVADKLGYYEDAGIKLKIVQAPDGDGAPLVAAGDAQFGVSFQDYLAPAYTDNPMPVTAIAAILQHNTSGLISLKASGIESAKDLEGKSYATWEMPVEQAMIRYMMDVEGADFQKVNLVPETMDALEALRQNVDSVWIYYAWDGIASELAGLETNMIYFKDVVPEFDYYSPVFITNNSLIDSDPELVKAFLEATKKGYEYAIENPDKAADILCEAAEGLDTELVHASQKWISEQYIADAERWGYIDPARWNAFYNWLYENKLYDKIPENTGFTNEYLPE